MNEVELDQVCRPDKNFSDMGYRNKDKRKIKVQKDSVVLIRSNIGFREGFKSHRDVIDDRAMKKEYCGKPYKSIKAVF